jgi:hypothetical protein
MTRTQRTWEKRGRKGKRGKGKSKQRHKVVEDDSSSIARRVAFFVMLGAGEEIFDFVSKFDSIIVWDAKHRDEAKLNEGWSQ